MKLIPAIILVLSTTALANNVREWKPKYSLLQKSNKATIQKNNNEKKINTSKQSIKKSDRINLKSAALSKPQSITPNKKMSSQVVSESELNLLYKRKYKSKAQYSELKNKTLALTQKAVPTLIKVIKSADYPDKNRWIAMFMLGRIMGKKSSNFISKFSAHPNWMMRLASLKVLLALDQKQYKGLYTRLLKDKAMIVRHQALDNIKQMDLKELAPYVWAMLYDKSNYAGSEGARKRAHIIKEAIKTCGDLEFKASKKPMLKMISDKKYVDVFSELDYSLNKLSAQKSPDDSLKAKKHFWTRKSIENKVIR